MEKPKRSESKYWFTLHDFDNEQYIIDLENYITYLHAKVEVLQDKMETCKY